MSWFLNTLITRLLIPVVFDQKVIETIHVELQRVYSQKFQEECQI